MSILKREPPGPEIHLVEPEPARDETESSGQIPKFFTDRLLGWAAIAVVILVATVCFAIAIEYPPFILVAVALDLFCLGYGGRLLYIAKKKDYFVMRLTCVGSRPLGVAEGLAAYLDPTSSTAFKSSKVVSFQTESGQIIYMTYERSRKFIPGARYDFYFRKPPKGQPITTQLLEQLRIDHSIVPDQVADQDIKSAEGEEDYGEN